MDTKTKGKNQTLPEGITAEMVETAKAKHGEGKVVLIDIINDDTNETKTLLVAVPSRFVIGQYQRYESADPKKAQEILVKNCLLSNKDEVLTDDGLFFGALSGIAELIPARRAVVKTIDASNLPEGITAEMVTAARTKYGTDKVVLIDIINDETGETKTVLAAVPSRSVIGQYQRFEAADPKKAQEKLVKNCLLSNKDEVLADDGLFFGALSGIAELIPVRRVVVKNL